MILRHSSEQGRIIFTNQKGGVGKTTTLRELAFFLATYSLRVLLVDCDPQGNLTKSLGKEPWGLYEALIGEGEAKAQVVNPNLSILGGGLQLALLEKHLLGEIDAYRRLIELFEGEEFQGYDLILLDTPPSLGVLTINALAACDKAVIPMNPSLYSMQGANDLMATIAKVRKNLNPGLSMLGVIINAFDSVPVITRQIRTEIEEAFGDKVFETVLSKSIKIEEAIARKTGVIHLKRLDRSRAKDEIESLGNEFLKRLGIDISSRLSSRSVQV